MRLVLALSAQRTRYGEALTSATLHRIRATLRAALNAAIRAGLISENAARRSCALPTNPVARTTTARQQTPGGDRRKVWRGGVRRPGRGSR